MKCIIVCLFVFYLGFMTIEANEAGGITDADPNDPQVKNVLEFCETMLDKAVNSPYSHKAGKIIKAQTQVVSGLKYYLTFEFSETNCLKNRSPNEVAVCDITKTEICTAEVWSRPWLTTGKMEILSFNCKAQP